MKKMFIAVVAMLAIVSASSVSAVVSPTANNSTAMEAVPDTFKAKGNGQMQGQQMQGQQGQEQTQGQQNQNGQQGQCCQQGQNCQQGQSGQQGQNCQQGQSGQQGNNANGQSQRGDTLRRPNMPTSNK